jgi:hypothetical protein
MWENCTYGYVDAYDAMVSWVESGGHYFNLINPEFYRIGGTWFSAQEVFYQLRTSVFKQKMDGLRWVLKRIALKL